MTEEQLARLGWTGIPNRQLETDRPMPGVLGSEAEPVTETTRDCLKNRPIDPIRRLPIPFVQEAEDPTKSFIALNGARQELCLSQRLCGVCGEPLGYWICFIGGEQAFKNRSYVDPPMHEECAEAALELCPHLARKDTRRRKEDKYPEGSIRPPGHIDEKPEVFVVGKTRNYKTKVIRGTTMIRADAFKSHRRFSYDETGQLAEMVRDQP